MKRFALLAAFALCSCTAAEPVAPITPTPSFTESGRPAATFDVANVVEVVRGLTAIGPRETTSRAFRRAGHFVEARLRAFGYRVSRQAFTVPAGLSNFIAVPEGRTFNVVAVPAGFDATKRHLIVGAHLDSVPDSPGAVDNATGVGIMLELARLGALSTPRVPVVFVAFGGEEARVPRGGLHGSRAYVAAMSNEERAALVGAIVIDRVGARERVPVCMATRASAPFARLFLDAARRLHVWASACDDDSSDHVPFVRAGLTAVRIGPDEFAEYHTPRDVRAVLVPDQAARAGSVVWEVLSRGLR